MQLFESIERQDTGPASHSEDSFSYYNRSARTGVERIRTLLQQWFDHFPRSEQLDLARRFRADFDAAFFELFLHELTRRLGAEILPHPQVPTTSQSRPDFQLMDNTGVSYLEARVARDESSELARRRRVIAAVYDAINGLEIPDYFLQIAELTLLADRQPSMRGLCRQLQQWLRTLDYADLVARRDEITSLDALPTLNYQDSAIRVRISAIPVSEAKRGDPEHRPIGIYPMESRWGGSEASLRRALQRKGTKYGNLEAPFIIAVNSLSSWGFDRIDQMEALFGTEQIIVGTRDEEPGMARKPNGFWNGPKGPQHTRVSGVLFCQVGPWYVHTAQTCLYLNPWATAPYDGVLTALPRAVPTESKMSWRDGLELSAIFDLRPDWVGE
ncbi:MAG TPA: hypothetical protein VFJ82_24725 [Longimicrobium sp.]|nr:hypothetical protein [Longimicrobium sp.]